MAKRTTYGMAQLVEPTYKRTSIGGGKNIIHAGTGKYEGIKGNS